jgi:hypothetical protein
LAGALACFAAAHLPLMREKIEGVGWGIVFTWRQAGQSSWVPGSPSISMPAPQFSQVYLTIALPFRSPPPLAALWPVASLPPCTGSA